MGWNILSIPKLERLHHGSLGMDNQFHPKFYWACDYLSMLELELFNVSERRLCYPSGSYFTGVAPAKYECD